MKISNKTKGIICILFAAFGFSMMSAFVRLAGELPTFQKAFFRNFVALIVIGTTLVIKKQSFRLKKGNAAPLLGRVVFGTAGMLCNFYALDRLVLADANMLNKLSPFFAVVFSAVLLREKPKPAQIAGVIAAMIGSAFIIKPGFSGMSAADAIPAAAGLLGGLGAGIAYTFVRMLGKRGENGLLIVFYFSAFSCLVCLPSILFDYTPMSAGQLTCLILTGCFACIGQLGITKAYLYAPAKEISVYDYSQVIFAALLGFALFGQIPDVLSVVGYLLICGAGIAMFFYNRKESHRA